MTRAELLAQAELDALTSRLESLADPEQESSPSFADTDWRSLAWRCASTIRALRAQAEAAAEPPCNLPFERAPQHAGDPGYGPVPNVIPLGSRDPNHPSNQPQAEAAGEPVPVAMMEDYLPPLRDFMYHAVRGSDYTFTGGGDEDIVGYLNDECLEEIWDNINTAARTGRYAPPADRARELLQWIHDGKPWSMDDIAAFLKEGEA